MCIVTRLCCQTFEINLIFLIKPFFYMTKTSIKKKNILRTKIAFNVNKKKKISIFKELSMAKNCLRPESAPLKNLVYAAFIAKSAITMDNSRHYMN